MVLALLPGAATGANPGFSLGSIVFLTVVVAAGAVFTHRIWIAGPIDADLDRRVKYLPPALVRAMLPLFTACGFMVAGSWLDFLGAHLRAQPVHAIVLVLAALSLICAFAGIGLAVAVFAAGKPKSLVPPRMRR